MSGRSGLATAWRAGGALLVVLALSGCGGAAKEAAEAVYDACADHGALLPVVRLDGKSVYLEMKGENAKDALGGYTGEAVASERYEAAEECISKHTNFPGLPGHWAEGDEWEGWRYHYEDGAGYERANVFTATGQAVDLGATAEHERRKLEAVHDAVQAHARTARAERVAREARDRAIRAAVRAGVTYADIGRVSGLSAARVSHIAHAPNLR